MTKELEALNYIKNGFPMKTSDLENALDIIETALKDCKHLKEENKLLRESNENLDENYFDTWHACEKLKENNNYALMFVDGIYCLVDTKDNKFDVIDNYKVNDKGIIDNDIRKKLKALEIIKKKKVYLPFIEQFDLKYYNEHCAYMSLYEYYLTQTEYDLLKDVLYE